MLHPPSAGEVLHFDRFDAFRDSLCGTHAAWNMQSPVPNRSFEARIRKRAFGDVQFTDVSCDPCSGRRARGDIGAADGAFVALSLITAGSQSFSHGEVESNVRAGDLLLWSSARPGSFASDRRVDLLTVLFPHNLASQYIANLDDLCARTISRERPSGILLASHIRLLHDEIGQFSEEERMPVLRSTLEMIGAYFRPEQMIYARTSYQTALLRRVQSYVLENLTDRALTPGAVCEAFKFSTRYLHRLFASADTTFSDWVREQRLVRASRALGSPSFDMETVTQIAYRFGFADAPHFCRLFKQRFECTPQEYRRRARSEIA